MSQFILLITLILYVLCNADINNTCENPDCDSCPFLKCNKDDHKECEVHG